MARLARAAYAVIWVNPLKGNPEYQPLAGGMRAALPYVDRFLSGHNLLSLEELAAVVAGSSAVTPPERLGRRRREAPLLRRALPARPLGVEARR